MKTTIIIFLGVAALAALFIILQAFVYRTSNDIEMYPYEVLEEYPEFEIRRYDEANFSYVKLPRSDYRSMSGSGFRMLAGYIFGGNESGEKIAMTSPVAMNMEDSMTMMFMIPRDYDITQMPVPSNASVKFKTEPSKVVAAIRFGGWANDEKISDNAEKLKAMLQANGVDFDGSYSFLGYNPPYEVVNRRNEVIIPLSGYQQRTDS